MAGDNNYGDDRLLYAHGQLWLQRHHIMGRAVGYGIFLVTLAPLIVELFSKPVLLYPALTCSGKHSVIYNI